MENMLIYDTAIGKISIVETNNKITSLSFINEQDIEALNIEIKETPLLKETSQQLEQYFKGKLRYFDLPLLPLGTQFQKSVWNVLQSIPYGETWSYKEVAEKVGSSKAARAVGMANNKNPISILIPCHRVIGSNGKLVGYGGGLNIKEYLLNMEKQNISSDS